VTSNSTVVRKGSIPVPRELNPALRGITGFPSEITGLKMRERRAYAAIVLGYTGITGFCGSRVAFYGVRA
jgi:hypothetical protein